MQGSHQRYLLALSFASHVLFGTSWVHWNSKMQKNRRNLSAIAAWEAQWKDNDEAFCKPCSFASARDWLESMPDGAYTVVRCEFGLQSQAWSICGGDFHWSRLEDSFATIMPDTRPTDMTAAIEQTKHVTHHILDKAKNDPALVITEPPGPNMVQVAMLTILWSPASGAAGVQVRGHLGWIGAAVDLQKYTPSSIQAIVASFEENLPNRLANPQAKLSSWCRERRPLEALKPEDTVSEVILCRDCDGALELLEGLTTNLFVLYDDGSIRTAADDSVLMGYVRKLVLQVASRMGVRVDTKRPILIEEADKWREVFVTSSIKLLVPVSSVSLADVTTGGVESLWSLDTDEKIPPLWVALYEKVLSSITRQAPQDIC